MIKELEIDCVVILRLRAKHSISHQDLKAQLYCKVFLVSKAE